jgi:dihydrodipicolinate synthase/N-acetylneuraminate lyase
MLARYVPAVITPCGNVERAELHRLADAILRDGSSKVIALTGNGIVRYLRADAKVAA